MDGRFHLCMRGSNGKKKTVTAVAVAPSKMYIIVYDGGGENLFVNRDCESC